MIWQGSYVGKTIEAGFIKVNLMSNLNATDTIRFTGTSNHPGRTAPAGSVFIPDTIINMFCTDFDCVEKEFINTLYASRQWTTGWEYKTISERRMGFAIPAFRGR